MWSGDLHRPSPIVDLGFSMDVAFRTWVGGYGMGNMMLREVQ
jgi:hypothetical protein